MSKASIALPLVLLVAGCGAGTTTRTVTEPSTPKAAPRPQPKSQPKRVAAAHCPPGIGGCKAVRGLVVYVQAVDPDGDGDAHFAVVDRHSLTYPGIAVVKLTREMRPRRLPREGDEASAAGPVQESSDGSPEIRAAVLHVSPR